MAYRLRIATPALLLAVCCHAQNASSDAPEQLLNHLVGRWVMNGTIAGKPVTHDADVEWILKREYLRFHEVSREKDAGGVPAYEAIVFLSWEQKKVEYSCLWMDNTEGGALSSEVTARARATAGAIPLVFTRAGKELLHTTFRYDGRADSWQLTIDDVTSGKSDRFADLHLTRNKTP